MTRQEMRAWLSARYDEQVAKFPRLAEVPRERYVTVNLAYMVRSQYWTRRAA